MFNLSKIKYSMSQAKKNVIRNGLMSVASLFTITCCLLILGLFTIISFNINFFSEQLKDQCEVQAYMLQGTSDERMEEIKTEIENIENVKTVSLYTKEELYEFAMNDVFKGKEDMMPTYDENDNPFSDSYQITLVDISKTAQTISEIEKINDMEHVEDRQELTNIIIVGSNAIKNVSVVIMIILLVISMVIISNTVRLTVFNRRKEINIMKYIGATDRFIRTPFVMEGMLIGFIGALIAFGVVSWGYNEVIRLFGELLDSVEFGSLSLVPYTTVAPTIIILFVGFGCLIGVVGSLISMRKHLKV